MKNAFLEFQWRVAPAFKWHDWLSARGRPAAVPAREWARLESPRLTHGPHPEKAWQLAEDSAAALAKRTGPVLDTVDADASRPYPPLQQAALFREFAAVDYRDTANILGFATKYGHLGLVPQEQRVPRLNKSGRVRAWHTAHGESHFTWAFEICRMREAVELSEHRRSFERLRRLKWLCYRHLHHVAARMSFDGAGEPKLVIAPIDLISAMWLQLALALTGNKRFVACKFCRCVFEISTDQTGFRSDREFCTVACKTKDYRRRKRSARELAKSGLPVEGIADRLATNRATVRKWLAGVRELGKERT